MNFVHELSHTLLSNFFPKETKKIGSKGPVKLIKLVKIAHSDFYSLCQVSSTLSFQACLCSSRNGCQRIFRKSLPKMEKQAVLIGLYL